MSGSDTLSFGLGGPAAPSAWLHNACPSCWQAMRGTELPPPRATSPKAEACCWCGTVNDAGIYLRSDPKHLRCFPGNHPARSAP